MSMSAVSAEDDIVLPQMSTNRAGDRFFADVRMTGTVNQPALMAASQFLFRLTDHLHRSVNPQVD
jgi:hypothetical protein